MCFFSALDDTLTHGLLQNCYFILHIRSRQAALFFFALFLPLCHADKLLCFFKNGFSAKSFSTSIDSAVYSYWAHSENISPSGTLPLNWPARWVCVQFYSICEDPVTLCWLENVAILILLFKIYIYHAGLSWKKEKKN